MAKSLHLALIITVSPDVFSKEIEDFIRLSFLQPLQYFTLCFFCFSALQMAMDWCDCGLHS